MVFENLPRSYLVKKCKYDPNKQRHQTKTPGEALGVQRSFLELLWEHFSQLVRTEQDWIGAILLHLFFIILSYCIFSLQGLFDKHFARSRLNDKDFVVYDDIPKDLCDICKASWWCLLGVRKVFSFFWSFLALRYCMPVLLVTISLPCTGDMEGPQPWQAPLPQEHPVWGAPNRPI